MANQVILKEITHEAASMAMGKKLKAVLEPFVSRNEEVVVDFESISRFASPFFNNSFSALAIQYGFGAIQKVSLKGISEIGRDTYDSSLENAKLLSENPDYKKEISKIVCSAPKKTEK